jgi:hypothetical protein
MCDVLRLRPLVVGALGCAATAVAGSAGLSGLDDTQKIMLIVIGSLLVGAHGAVTECKPAHTNPDARTRGTRWFKKNVIDRARWTLTIVQILVNQPATCGYWI